LKVEMPNVFGPEQEAMPKIGFWCWLLIANTI
jgi:hypothetical protein